MALTLYKVYAVTLFSVITLDFRSIQQLCLFHTCRCMEAPLRYLLCFMPVALARFGPLPLALKYGVARAVLF